MHRRRGVSSEENVASGHARRPLYESDQADGETETSNSKSNNDGKDGISRLITNTFQLDQREHLSASPVFTSLQGLPN